MTLEYCKLWDKWLFDTSSTAPWEEDSEVVCEAVQHIIIHISFKHPWKKSLCDIWATATSFWYQCRVTIHATWRTISIRWISKNGGFSAINCVQRCGRLLAQHQLLWRYSKNMQSVLEYVRARVVAAKSTCDWSPTSISDIIVRRRPVSSIGRRSSGVKFVESILRHMRLQ